jgi:YHS domain-containing protein
MKSLWNLFGIAVAALSALSAFVAAAESSQPEKAKPAAPKEYNLSAGDVALQGYDPVAYFTDGKPAKGAEHLSAEHGGVAYRFATEGHREAFRKNPEKYLPTYGGWCATAMAKGEKVEIDPANFKVTNGRLFLFYKGIWGNARKDWDKDEPAQTVKADANWRKISGE